MLSDQIFQDELHNVFENRIRKQKQRQIGGNNSCKVERNDR